MKKIIVVMAIVIILGVLAACGQNSETAVSPIPTPGMTETPKAIETPAEPETRNWSCKATVREIEDGTLEIEYTVVEIDGNETYNFIEKPMFDKAWVDMYNEAGGTLHELTDFNFDGYPDIRTQQYGAMVNQYYNIRIWNETSDEFVLNQDYMEMSNPLVDPEKKQIFTTNYDKGLGNHILYKVEEGVLVKIAEITVVFNNDGSFTYTETVGENEGKVITSESELDTVWESYKVTIL